MGGKLLVVAGAQYGSEAKGHVVDQLSRREMAGDNVVVVRVAGPNAGHTVYGDVCPDECNTGADHWSNDRYLGHPWRLRSVPVAAVSNPDADLVVAAGSEIDRSVLLGEVALLDQIGYKVSERLRIDAQATLLRPKHIDQEVRDGIQQRLGSTAKGIGAARSDRIWRYAQLWGDQLDSDAQVDTAEYIRARLSQGATVIIEGTQGYGLGLHAGHYPQCTSSDCRAIDFLAMAGVSPWWPEVTEFGVWLAARVRPIRVAGNSGPMKGETTWQDLHLPEEFTTVTKKVRRVGEWDGDLVRSAVNANGGAPTVRLALTMVDTLFDEVTNAEGLYEDYQRLNEFGRVPLLDNYIVNVEREVGAPVRMVATSPNTVLWRP